MMRLARAGEPEEAALSQAKVPRGSMVALWGRRRREAEAEGRLPAELGMRRSEMVGWSFEMS